MLNCRFLCGSTAGNTQVERRHLEAAVDDSIKTLAMTGDDGPPSTSDDLQVNHFRKKQQKYLTSIRSAGVEAQRCWRWYSIPLWYFTANTYDIQIAEVEQQLLKYHVVAHALATKFCTNTIPR